MYNVYIKIYNHGAQSRIPLKQHRNIVPNGLRWALLMLMWEPL